MLKRILYPLAFLQGIGALWAQDSLVVFSESEFLEIVVQHHPVASQAELLSEFARQEVRAARGSFDPKWETTLEEKTFKNTRYWSTWTHELKIPVWTNTDLKLGYDKANGQYLNSEFTNTVDGLVYAGISVPLLQGLLTDGRRTALRQAQLMPEMMEAEQVKTINKLILEAVKEYWNWSNAYRQFQLQQEGVRLAQFRFDAIRERVFNGDAAPIDSVEALITLRTRENDLREAEVSYRNAVLMMSNYLWNEDGQPLELNDNVVPEAEVSILPLSDSEMGDLLTAAQQFHPDLIKLDVKARQLAMERRLNVEMLKPAIGLNYNFLAMPTDISLQEHAFFDNNYKLGLTASVPLFLRKERSKLAITKLKITENQLSFDNSRRRIQNEVLSTYNTLITSAAIIDAQRNIVSNYETLRAGEVAKFSNGESSLFLVNTRESKLLESRAKLIKAETDYQKDLATLYWAAGRRKPF